MNFIRSFFLTRFFFVLFGALVVCAALAFVIPFLLFWAKVGLISLVGITILDTLLLYAAKNPIAFKRQVETRMNLGDECEVNLTIKNQSSQLITYTLMEGFPIQMQERTRIWNGTLLPSKSHHLHYYFTPKTRGEYFFEDAYFHLSSLFHLVGKKMKIEAKEAFCVYPSVLQMKKYELMVFQQQKVASGIKKIRRLGNNSEFEQIRTYVQGDEIKRINWKATSRGRELMVNQYQEEKSQQVFCIIDKSRTMQMEFDGLSMLDYAINSTLVLSNIMLKKGDKTGVITFSDKLGTTLPAEKAKGQMKRILELLYNQKTHFKDANFELLFEAIRMTAKTRSLLLLFTNFETESSMHRALPLLRKLSQKHVLVVLFFQNNELEEMAFQEVQSTRDIYQTTVAERMITVKHKIAMELRKNGIHAILTRPEDVSLNAINKYLELKARGTI